MASLTVIFSVIFLDFASWLQTEIMPLSSTSCPLKISALMQSTVHARIPASLSESRLFIPALFLPIPASLKNTAFNWCFCAYSPALTPPCDPHTTISPALLSFKKVILSVTVILSPPISVWICFFRSTLLLVSMMSTVSKWRAVWWAGLRSIF